MRDAMKDRSAKPGSGGPPMKIALRSRPAERLRGAGPRVVAAVLGLAGAAMADGFKISEKVTATPAAPGARGLAVVVAQGAGRCVRVAARGLRRSTTLRGILARV